MPRCPRRSATSCIPDSRLKGEANLLVMPNLDAANISFNLMKMANGDGVSVGPILLGAAKPVHIVTPSATVRRLVNMTALAVVDAKESGALSAAGVPPAAGGRRHESSPTRNGQPLSWLPVFHCLSRKCTFRRSAVARSS